MDVWTRIAHKLNVLRSLDTNYTLFGAESHQYSLSPCLSEAVLQAFETHHQIQIPSDYRGFLKYIGNGGAGPYYGIFSLQQSLRAWCITEDATYLTKPFPLTTNLVLSTLDPETDFDAYGGSYYTQGSLDVCHYGCAVYFLVVVTGPERGNIWIDDRASDVGIFALAHPSNKDQRVTFLQWYEQWLDSSMHVAQGHSLEEHVDAYFAYSQTPPERTSAIN